MLIMIIFELVSGHSNAPSKFELFIAIKKGLTDKKIAYA